MFNNETALLVAVLRSR